jgi:hypothetical protein
LLPTKERMAITPRVDVIDHGIEGKHDEASTASCGCVRAARAAPPMLATCRLAARHESSIQMRRENMSIARLTTAFALGLPGVHLSSGAAVACDNPGRTRKLSFKVTEDGCVAKVKKDSGDADAETINVCEKDAVEWKVTGKAKSIVFDGNSPFEWADSGF